MEDGVVEYVDIFDTASSARKPAEEQVVRFWKRSDYGSLEQARSDVVGPIVVCSVVNERWLYIIMEGDAPGSVGQSLFIKVSGFDEISVDPIVHIGGSS